MKNKMKTIKTTCSRCNKPFSYAFAEAVTDDTGAVLCLECRRKAHAAEVKRRAEIKEKRVCRDCSKEFTVTVGEAEWFESKEFPLPVRCHACRAHKRQKAAMMAKNAPKKVPVPKKAATVA